MEYRIIRVEDENYELYHHGVKGMKWGVRRYQNADGTLTAAGKKRNAKTIKKINSMYDHSNKWTERKIRKLDKKGKTAKADVMREMYNRNEAARKRQITAINKMNAEQYNKARKTAIADSIFGGQLWMEKNSVTMNTSLSRMSEYSIDRGMRWMSNFTLNSTLNRMSPSDGYNYLNRKTIYSYGAASSS